MGNCVFRCFTGVDEVIRVVTSNGGIMELYAPITAESITNDFPGHGIFRSCDLFAQPLLRNEELLVGELYYILPLNAQRGRVMREEDRMGLVAPYRMSFDSYGVLKRAESEVFSRYSHLGVWKVKLVISPDELKKILAQEARTEALIESVRTVAKCSYGLSSSSANSDQWSLSSSRKASSSSETYMI